MNQPRKEKKQTPQLAARVVTPAKRVAYTGLLFALALVLSLAESAILPLLGLPPGVKIGLANVVVLYALLFLSRRMALWVVVLKAGAALLFRGVMAGALSAAGGGLALLAMVLLTLPQKPASVLVLSVVGAVCHNIGQLLLVRLWYGPGTLWYVPVLLVSGLGMGILTAVLLRVLLPALGRVTVHLKRPKP